jgi:hypothetical protein
VIYIQIYKALRREIALSPEVIRGSAVFLDRLCGKPNCRCMKGHKHRSLYLSRSYKGKTTMTYVPKMKEAKILEGAARYRKIQNLLNELSETNLKKLLEGR